MFEIVRPEKDATIYGYLPNLNSGIDEILELNTSTNDTRVSDNVSNPVLASRVLLEFDFDVPEEGFNQVGVTGSATPNVFGEFGIDTTTRTTSVLPNDEGINVFGEFGIDLAPDRQEPKPEPPVEEDEPDADVWLRMYFARGEGLPQSYDLQVFSVQKSWSEGLGRRNNDPPTEVPVNWIERQESIDWNGRGGDFDTAVSVSEAFDINDSPDVFFRINELFNDADPDDGILLKRRREDLDRFSQLSFFSRNTNTVFVPHLLVGRETFEYDVPENAEVFENTESMSVFITNLRESYGASAKTRFRVKVREKFPDRDFLGIRPSERRERRQNPEPEPYLPRRSLLYEIRDARTEEPVHPFSDPYTVVSYDSDGHYFDLDLSNLFPKRPYEILFKFVDPVTKNEQIFAPEQYFETLSA